MGKICPKNTFLQLKHYIQRIYSTLLSTTSVKIHQIPYVSFEIISHFFMTQLVCIILAQLLHTFDKNIPSKCKFFTAQVKIHQISHVIFQTKSESFIFKVCKFSNLPLLALKFTKFVVSFSKPRASFSSNFASPSIVKRDNSSVLFHLKLYMLSTRRTHQVQIFRLSTGCMKTNKIPSHFSSQESVLVFK